MSVHLIDPWEQFTGPEPIRPRLRGNDYCNPGEPSDPGESCSWHPEHYYCEVCLGWYGASHDGTHGGTGYGWPHPGSRPDQCACRLAVWPMQLEVCVDHRVCGEVALTLQMQPLTLARWKRWAWPSSRPQGLHVCRASMQVAVWGWPSSMARCRSCRL